MNLEPERKANPHWLRLDFDRLPNQETLEYSFNKTMIAASAVFKLSKTEQGLSAEASIRLKVPFRGHFVFEVTSVSRPEDHPAQFSIYKEWQDEKPTRVWLASGETLKCVVEGEPRKSFGLSDVEPVLNPLLLLTLFSSWRNDSSGDLAAQFVVSDKVYALKFSVTGSEFSVFHNQVSHPLGSSEWSQLNWPSAASLEGTWSAERQAVSSLRVRVPLFGLIELPLAKASRS